MASIHACCLFSPCTVASLSWKPSHRCWKGPLSFFFSRLNNRHSSSTSPHKAKAHNSSQSWQLSPLNSLQFINISFVPGREAQLDAVFWTWSNECQMEWDNCLTRPTGCAPVNVGHRLSLLSSLATKIPEQAELPPEQAVLVQGVTPDRETARKPPPFRSCLNGKFA